jgi:uncharacterized protein (DUF1330 family)
LNAAANRPVTLCRDQQARIVRKGGRLAIGGVAAGGDRMTIAESVRYLEPTQASGRAFLQRAVEGPVVMLNLLRFREVADYAASPELAPDTPISGAEAFARYVAHTLPHLEASGGELLFLGQGGPFLIGPEGERWDRVMLIRQASAQSFMAFASNAAYLAGLGHRTAALLDSRLLPMVQMAGPKSPA